MGQLRLDFTPSFTLILLELFTVLVTVGFCQSGFYHLTNPDRACHSVETEGSTVDLVCQFFDQGAVGSGSGACRLRSLHWQRMGVRTITNVSDSTKYGLRGASTGWGVRSGEHVSLLRIRNIQPTDLGTYRCEIQCVDDEGIPHRAYHYSDVCLRQPNNQYGICVSHVDNDFCAAAFWNGVCDLDCMDQKNLFDGFECMERLEPCNTAYEGYCASRFENGNCDPNCDNPECGWDGGDCISTSLKFAEDTLVLFLGSSGWHHRSSGAIELKELGRSLSRLLRTIVRVLPDNWQADHTVVSDPHREHSTTYLTDDTQSARRFHRVFLKLDNTHCKRQCFRKAERAAQFISTALQNGWDPGVPIITVAVLSRVGSRCELENNSMLQIDWSRLEDPYGGPGGADTSGTKSPLRIHTWMLVVVVAGGLCLLILVTALTLIACRLRTGSETNEEKQRPRHMDTTRIPSEKHGPPGVDV